MLNSKSDYVWSVAVWSGGEPQPLSRPVTHNRFFYLET